MSKIISRHKVTGQTAVKSRCGRPRKTTIQDDRLITRQAVRNPFITSTAIKRKFAGQISDISTRTIRRRLVAKFQCHARKPLKKPLLTKRMRLKRVQFCQQYRHWTSEQWRRVMFSDESSFEMKKETSAYVRRPQGSSPFNPRYTIKSTKHPPAVMVWGCFSYKARGALTFLPTGCRMNGGKYIDVLNEKLQTFMAINDATIFQHDRAPCHTAGIVTEWFRERGIEVLPWPGNSPDINPIENLWQFMKNRLQQRHFSSMTEFKDAIKTIWVTDLTQDYCSSLIDSMPRRIQAILDNNGFPTKY